MTSSAEFTDPRLVSLYDIANPAGPDTEFFLSLPGADDRTVLDVGCGTGMLAVEYSRAGLQVVGVDPAQEMLRVARNRPGGDPVSWRQSNAADFDVPQRFDLAVMTSHVFQFFLDDDTSISSLRNIRRHLNDGGRLAFESRNPLDRAWERWTRDLTLRTVTHPQLGSVTIWIESQGLQNDVVRSTLHYEAPGMSATADNQMRFPSRDVIANQLDAADFMIENLYGNWDRSSLTEASPEFIIVARAAG